MSVKITSKSIVDTIERQRNGLKDRKVYKQIMNEIAVQKDYENSLLMSHNSCPANVDEKLVAENLDSLDYKKLKSDIGSTFYNGDMMKAVMCIASSVVLDIDPTRIEMTTRIRNMITDLRLFGEKSVSGFALRGSLGSTPENKAENLFVIKAPRDPTDAQELTHELIVAFYGTNQLRSLGIPNFAYVYGGMFCSPPFMDSSNAQSNEILSFCNSGTKDPVMYAIYENIAPAISFTEYVKNPKECTGENFMNYYIQAIVAVQAANLICGFTHYDFHGGNVLIRSESKTPFSYVVPTPDGDMYLTSNGGIPTIIDYGMSHIELNFNDGRIEHFGHVGASAPLNYYGVNRNSANPIYDAYKLLCFSLSSMTKRSYNEQTKNWDISEITNPAFNELKGLLSFFTNEDPLSVVNKQIETYYSLPFTQMELNLKLYDFIKFCNKYCAQKGWRFALSAIPPSNAPVMTCDSNCVSTLTELKNLGALNETPIPETFSGFISSYNILYNSYKSNKKTSKSNAQKVAKKIENLKKNFLAVNFEKALANEVNIFETIKPRYKQFPVIGVPPTWTTFIDSGVLDATKKFVSDSIRYYDTWQRLKTFSSDMMNISAIYVNSLTNPNFLGLMQEVSSLLESNAAFNTNLNNTVADLVYLVNPPQDKIAQLDATGRADFDYFDMVTQDRYGEMYPEYEKYGWYRKTMPSIATLIA